MTKNIEKVTKKYRKSDKKNIEKSDKKFLENVNLPEDDPTPDELRRRRLAAFDNLDLD